MKCENGRNSCRTAYAQRHAAVAFLLARVGVVVFRVFRCVSGDDGPSVSATGSSDFGSPRSTGRRRPVSTAVRNALDTEAGSQNTGIIAAHTYGNMPGKRRGNHDRLGRYSDRTETLDERHRRRCAVRGRGPKTSIVGGWGGGKERVDETNRVQVGFLLLYALFFFSLKTRLVRFSLTLRLTTIRSGLKIILQCPLAC